MPFTWKAGDAGPAAAPAPAYANDGEADPPMPAAKGDAVPGVKNECGALG